MNFKLRAKDEGITLIALVVTIIILIILAAVTLSIVSNSNIVGYAVNGVHIYMDAEEAENEALNKTTSYMDSVLGKNEGEDAGEDKVLVEKTTSYVGYYADMDADGEVDGVIYADLAVGGSGTWNSNSWSSYSYSAQEGLKDYYISKTDYEGIFGTKDVLSPTGSGNDRFYVMALENVDSSRHYWYWSAYGNLDSSYNVSSNTNDFGEGKANTIRMVNAWKNSTYGSQNGGSTTYNPDLWGLIQDSNSCSYDIVTSASDSKKWFVPSKAEWSAFGDYLYTDVGVTKSNYENYGLGDYYWSSSQYDSDRTYSVAISGACIANGSVNNYSWVRLSVTF